MSNNAERMADFLFEIGMLKKTPRTGYRFLGAEGESVAEHSFRTAVIAYTLAHMHGGVEPANVALMALFHDTPEARTGDLNYVYKKYNQTDEQAAAADLTRGLPFEDDLSNMLHAFRQGASVEAQLARDADQLDLLCDLVIEKERNNPQADDWITVLLKRLTTEQGQTLATAIQNTRSEQWWFANKGPYWVHGKGPGGP